MTSEEFFRKKIKEKNPGMETLTLSMYVITAEEAMIWSHEFSQLEKSEKPIIPEISDEEIEMAAPYVPRDAHDYYVGDRDGFIEGAKWYREQLKLKGGEQ